MRALIATLALLIVLQTAVLIQPLYEIKRLREEPSQLIYCDDVNAELVDGHGEE